MTSQSPKRSALRVPIAVVSLALAASLPGSYGNAQELATHGPWQISVFATGGFPPNYRLYEQVTYPGGSYNEYATVQLDLLNAGVQIGRLFPGARGPSALRGTGEAIVEVMPFWLAHYPLQNSSYGGGSRGVIGSFPYGPRYVPGASVTPLLFRWNFTGPTSKRSVPWAQIGGGLLWTNHNFPIDPLTGLRTSAINFTPQGGIGESIFVRKNRSLDFAAKVVHISNAGLGKSNPGLDYTLQFSAGYSWWK